MGKEKNETISLKCRDGFEYGTHIAESATQVGREYAALPCRVPLNSAGTYHLIAQAS
jgi:hypothetical protein